MSIEFENQIAWEEYASSLAHNATDTERLMVAICFRFEVENVDTTRVSIVANDYFRRARWPRPVNLSATANHCAGKGWLTEVSKTKNRKNWRITRKGYDSIRNKIEMN